MSGMSLLRHVTALARTRRCLTGAALLFLCTGGMLLSGCPAEYAVANTTCLACHDGRSASDQRGFLEGAHGGVSCERCHGAGFQHVRNGGRNGLFIDNPGDAEFASRDDACATCHAGLVNVFSATAHFTGEGASCIDCHDVHRRGGMVVDVAEPAEVGTPELAAICGRCHESEVADTALSQHAIIGFADCLTCHNPHSAVGFAERVADNTLCTDCHSYLGFENNDDLVAHAGPWHPADPAGSGSGRCTACHMVPLQFEGQPSVPLGHSMNPVPPQVTNNAIAAGAADVPPNTCSGILGCHDPNVPGSGQPRDLYDTELNEDLQDIFELTGAKP